jgi:RNA polymerase sigma-70 factor (ECF subfamily)
MRYATALTRDPEAAEELVEDTVREALAWQLHCTGNVRLWLLRLLHELRDNPFRQGTVVAGSFDRAPAAAPLTLSQLDRALGQLPEEQRAIILLIGLERMTYTETAAILGIPVGTMRSRLSRGRAALCRALGVVDAPRVSRAA